MLSRPRVAVVTHARKEPFFCTLFSRHYGALFGPENLYLYKDGDDWDLPPDARFGTVTPVDFPRDRQEFDRHFPAYLGAECARLLQRYDVVLRTDVDEFLVPDPNKGSWDDILAEAMEAGYLYATGLDVVQHMAEEAPYDPALPVLQQRRNALFRGEYSKPCVIARPVRWGVACHLIEGEPVVLSRSLTLFHLANMDRGLLDARVGERGDYKNPSYRAHAKWRLKLFTAIQTEPTEAFDQAETAIRTRLLFDDAGRPARTPRFKKVRAPDGSVRSRWLKLDIPERFAPLICPATGPVPGSGPDNR